jgi:phosphomevalonate kinase
MKTPKSPFISKVYYTMLQGKRTRAIYLTLMLKCSEVKVKSKNTMTGEWMYS